MDFEISDDFIRREKEAARVLRKSRWWQNLLAQAKCYYCLAELRKAEATMDHIVPISRGGRSTKGNVVLSCKNCNALKQDMTVVEWEAYLQERLGPEKPKP
jgi:5-methylcytosine-specific restriction endonuclease McrA